MTTQFEVKKVERWQVVNMELEANRLGRDGWMLVAIDPHGAYVFRRQMPSVEKFTNTSTNG